MIIYMPELNELEELERRMDLAQTAEEYAKLMQKWNFVFVKLRREIEEE